MEQNNKRRAEDAERLPAEKLEWYERPTKWTLLMTADNHGLVGEFGSKWEGHPAHYERINVQSLDVPDCGACPGDGSICPATCKLAEDSPPCPAAPAVDAAKLDDLGKLKALAEAATPGPWVADENWNGEGSSIVDSRGEVVADDGTAGGEYSERLNARDAAYIAAANPAAILRIAALVAQQAARIAELTEELRIQKWAAEVNSDGHKEEIAELKAEIATKEGK